MEPKKKAVTAAVAGAAVGLAGLGLIALPAGAGEAPTLPAVSAEDLLQSVLTAQTPAFDGTVQVTNGLGLPSIPGMASLNLDSAQVFNDGRDASKVLANSGDSVETMVRNGQTVWTYDSAAKSAHKITLPAGAGMPNQGELSDPTKVAAAVLERVRQSSTVTVEGTAQVAGRSAYEIVLTPKPGERTVLREVRVSVDSQTRLPLRLAVLTNGSADPALQVAFSEFEVAAQPAELFQFTPPQGTKVTEDAPQAPDQRDLDKLAKDQVKVVGEGWDTVVTGKVPAEVRAPQNAQQGAQPEGERPGAGQQMNPQTLLRQFGKPVSGPFGSGYLITTRVGSALVTDDGRFAAGAVPEQVLVDALGAK